jgi:hypothetical protein
MPGLQRFGHRSVETYHHNSGDSTKAVQSAWCAANKSNTMNDLDSMDNRNGIKAVNLS